MTQFAIVTDLNKCVGCLACTVGCKSINTIPVGAYWNKVLRVGPNPKAEGGTWPNVEMYFLPIGCQHCENPFCVKVCPTGASQKTANGTVQIDKEKCIGCQFCVMACPYGVRYLNKEEGVVEKCTLCNQLIEAGDLPQCVTQCSCRARWFGDLEKGIAGFEGPIERDRVGADKSYDALRKQRMIMGEYIKPWSASELYTLPDVGNKPSFRYILRGRKWQG